MQKLAIRIWDTIARDTFGSLFRPWQIRREGRAHAEARRDEMLLLEQAQKDLHDIRAGKKRLSPEWRLEELPSPEASEDPVQSVHAQPEEMSLNLCLQEADQQAALDRAQEYINLARTVRYAEEEVTNDTSEPPDEYVEFDWIHRWREDAKNVSTEELQRLWARTLAGEVKTPGTYSLRTLDFLKNLTRKEAIKIQRLASFLVADAIFDDCRDQLSHHGLSFDDLLEMQELGILEGVDSATLAVTFDSIVEDRYLNHLVGYSKVIEVTKDDRKARLQLHASSLTRLGKQILSLGDFVTDQGYILHVASRIAKKGFKVRIGEWVPSGDSGGAGHAHSFKNLPDDFGG